MVRILETPESTGNVTLPTAENDDYKVTISYDKSVVTNIPDGATVSVTSYADDSDQYKTAKEAVIAAKKAADENFEEDSLGLKALDISILDSDKNEIEPKDKNGKDAKVSVKIELKTLPDGVDEGTELDVEHIKTSTSLPSASAYSLQSVGAKRSRAKATTTTTAETVAEGVKASEIGTTLSFTVDNFSTFTVTWTRNSNQSTSLTVTCVDEDGDALPNGSAPSIISLTSGNALSVNSTNTQLAIDGYEFLSAAASVRSYDWNEYKYVTANYSNVTSVTATRSYGSWSYSLTYNDNGTSRTVDDISIDDLTLTLTYAQAGLAARFDANGGTGTVDTIKSDDKTATSLTFTFPEGTSLSRTGYEFVGWADSADATSAQYQAGKTATITESKTYYAVWSQVVTVTFDANGGNTTPDPQTMTGRSGNTITLPNYTGTREGYEFLGWSDDNDLTNDVNFHQVYKAGSSYDIPASDTTLYAVWNNTETKQSAWFYVRLDGTIPTEPGFYAQSAYTSGFSIDSDIKKTQWIVDTTHRSIDGPNAINDVTDDLVTLPTVDQLVSDLNNSSSSLGFTVKNDNGKLVVDEITSSTVNEAGYNVKAGDELYVLWYVQKLQNNATKWHIDGSLLVKSYITLTYDKNTDDVVNSMPYGYQVSTAQNIPVGSSQSPTGTIYTPTRTGYVFEGWDTQADGNGTRYQTNDTYYLDHDTILYAQWSKGYNHLTVNKKDEVGNVLKGATFTLEEKDGSTWTRVSIGTTSDAGTYTYNNVKSQTIYRLTETYAPNGFETRNSVCFEVTTGTNQEILSIFTVDESGNKVDAPSWFQATYKQASVSGGSGSISLNITDEAIKRKVVFVKTAADGTIKLSGAKFTLTKGNTAVTGVLAEQSGDDGVFSVSNATLTYGTYTMTETDAPTGYQTASPFTITLNDPTGTAATTDGTYTENTGMTFSEGAPASVSMTRATKTDSSSGANIQTTTYTYTITVNDKPQADVTVIKTDDKTPATKLGGVTFKLTKSVNGTDQAVSIKDVTNDNGEFTISEDQKNTGVKLTGLDNGNYKLTETAAPAGYIVQTSETTFTVGADGTVTLPTEQSYATLTSEGGYKITIQNTAGTALPNTGGMGTSPFLFGGLALILAASAIYLISKKRLA